MGTSEEEVACIAIESICVSFTIISVVAHFLLGVFYYCKTGTVPLKEHIIEEVHNLTQKRNKRHLQSDEEE